MLLGRPKKKKKKKKRLVLLAGPASLMSGLKGIDTAVLHVSGFESGVISFANLYRQKSVVVFLPDLYCNLIR